MIWIILAIFGVIVWFSNGLLVASLKADAVASILSNWHILTPLSARFAIHFS
jgi:hypothetical protein